MDFNFQASTDAFQKVIQMPMLNNLFNIERDIIISNVRVSP